MRRPVVRRLVVVFLLVASLSCESDCEYLGEAGGLCGERRVTVPFVAGAAGLPIIEATIAGKPVWLLVDTGASASFVSSSLLGTGGEGWTTIGALCIGGLCLRNHPAWAMDTVFSSAEPGMINGLLGMEALKHFQLELDHGKGLTLSRDKTTCPGPTHQLTFDEHGRPHLEASVDGRSLGTTLLDTGALFTLLSDQAVAGLPYLTDGAASSGGCAITGCTDTGKFTSTAKQFCVNTTCLDAVPVKYPVWDAIGGTFLRRFRTEVDFAGRTVRFCD
jgi:hypothetical protein